jgi:hypothetical protein
MLVFAWGRSREAYRVPFGISEEKTSLGRPKLRWDDIYEYNRRWLMIMYI